MTTRITDDIVDATIEVASDLTVYFNRFQAIGVVRKVLNAFPDDFTVAEVREALEAAE